MREAMKKVTPPSPITAEEIVSQRSVDACKQCHNKQSPSYKPFCLKERMKVIEHLDPRKKRSDKDLKKLRDICVKDCKICAAKKKVIEPKKADGGK